MKTTALPYPSADGASTVRAWLWEPDGNAEAPAARRGLVQIIHGMSEHAERYASCAEALCAAGYLVCANDHVGHGRTAAATCDLGHIPLAGGVDILLADVHALRSRVIGRLRAQGVSARIPYIFFGHSLGSFIVRVYLTQHAEGVSAAVICGTGQQPPALARAGNALCRVLARLRGEHFRSRLIHELVVGAYGRAIKGARTPYDWLSTDPAVVEAYQRDPLCGQMFTVGGYAAVTELAATSQQHSLARRIPRGLPLLFIAGSNDPVGDCGRGVRAAAKQYRDLGMVHVDEIGLSRRARVVRCRVGQCRRCAMIPERASVRPAPGSASRAGRNNP